MDWYANIVDGGRAGAFWLLVALLVTFVVTRLVTRRIRSSGEGALLGDVTIGGIHVHHLVFGMFLILGAGFVEFRFQPESPWFEVLAAVFGAGAALVLDEFALWLNLSDVYWAQKGRASIDAVVVAAVVGGLMVIGFTPLELDDPEDGSRLVVAVTAGTNSILAGLTFLKGKHVVGAVALFVPIVGLVSAIRLAKPGSPWSRWRYGSRPGRLARASERFGARYQRRWNRVRDLIGGAPDAPGDR